jgi:hypothetical protein
MRTVGMTDVGEKRTRVAEAGSLRLVMQAKLLLAAWEVLCKECEKDRKKGWKRVSWACLHPESLSSSLYVYFLFCTLFWDSGGHTKMRS